MPLSRTQQETADLFQAAGVQESCRTHTPARLTSAQRSAAAVSGAEKLPSRHLLPRDLSNALKQVDDGELDRLFAATCHELQRRGRSLTSTPVIRPNNPYGHRAACLGSCNNNNGRIARTAAARRSQCRVDTRPGQCGASSLQGGNYTFPHSETVRDLPVRRAQDAGVRISKGWKRQVISRPAGHVVAE